MLDKVGMSILEIAYIYHASQADGLSLKLLSLLLASCLDLPVFFNVSHEGTDMQGYMLA